VRPHQILDCVVTGDGRELVLSRRGDVFHIHIDRYELMASRAHGSEEELARLALSALGPRAASTAAPRVLIGGLGMGFTLRAALDALGDQPGAVVDIAEVFPAVVVWNRGPLAPLARHPLADPRVNVMEADVADVVAAAAGRYDAVLLDVDNGPEALTLESNHRLYAPAGLRRLLAALAPGGVLAVWSTDDDPRFAHRLRETGFTVTTRHVRARAGRGERHVVFVAQRPP
jgi:spermidine synthase